MIEITSQPLIILDTTDSRKLEVSITSNHPTVQIYDQNEGDYTPDWTIRNLKLSAKVYLNSDDITDKIGEIDANQKLILTWHYQAMENSNEEEITADVANKSQITISDNILTNNNMVATYICRVQYQGLEAFATITFSRVDTGKHGTDGTSVRILGTAVAQPASDKEGYYTINPTDNKPTTYELGDAYIHDGYDDLHGHLLVCVIVNDDVTGDDYFRDVGMIQGPAGKDGKDAISLSLVGNSHVFKVDRNGDISPSFITVTAHTVNLGNNIITWTCHNGGDAWIDSFSDVDGITVNDMEFTISSSAMINDSFIIKASSGIYSDIFTIYKVYDGDKGDSASIAFLTNENISFSANANGIVAPTNITTNVVAYTGDDKVLPTVGEPLDVPEGMTITVDSESLAELSKEVSVTISIDDETNLGSSSSNHGTVTIPVTYPVATTLKLSWSKINTGATGNPGISGADAVTFQIYSSNGYALSSKTPTLTLQTFAYLGDVEITAQATDEIKEGATYQWYSYTESGWAEITNATNAYLLVSREDVAFSTNYMCKMTFNGVQYTSVATVDDKSDSNKVFTSKPSDYTAGDLWIVGADYIPGNVEVGTLLRAQHTNTTYADSDWITATKYDEKIDKLQNNIDTYNQYFSFDSTTGLRISARDKNGQASQFSTSLTNERLSFNYGNESIAYIDGTKMNIKEAKIESPLTVTGKYEGSNMLQAPVINLGNFSLVVETNGSLSIIANT